MEENQQNNNQAPVEYDAATAVQNPSPIKKIVSLVIGAAVVIAIIALLAIFIIPKITGAGGKNVNLTYWMVFEDSAPLEEAASDFHLKNPNITVTIEKQDIKGLGKYVERLATRINNGTGPDLFRYHESWLSELYPYLMPLPAEVVNTTSLAKNYFPTITSDLKYNGAYYGVPINYDSLALFINTDIFKNAGISTYPATWDDLINVSRQLTVKDGNGKITQSGAALGTYDNIQHASDIISLLMVQNGADLKNLNAAPKSASDALEFYTNFAKGDTKVWDDSMENSLVAFTEGKVAMYFGYSWDIFQMKAASPNLQFITVPVPRLSSDRRETIASYWVEGVSAKTKHPKEAFEFLKFLADRGTMTKLYAAESKIRAFGELYPRSDMTDLLKSNNLIYPFVSQGQNAVSTIFASDTYDSGTIDALNKYMGDAIRSILNDGTSPATAVETLSSGVSQKLSQNGSSK